MMMSILEKIDHVLMHTFRENNSSADFLANLGCARKKKVSFEETPTDTSEEERTEKTEEKPSRRNFHTAGLLLKHRRRSYHCR
ncbi:hypothetical protein LguiA_031506 [Lonicera macranthoides]